MAKSKNTKITAGAFRAMAVSKPKRRDDEHSSQVAFFKEIAANTGKYPHWSSIFACPSGARTSMRTAKRLKAEGLRAGVPDIVCPFARSCYWALFIEMKTERNSPSSAQQDMIAMLIAQGNAVVVCTSSEQAMSMLLAYEEGRLTDDMLYKKYKRRKK